MQREENNRQIVAAPRKYICTVDESTLKCVAYEEPETKKTTDKKLLKYCAKHGKTRVLVRYPRGHHSDKEFMLIFQEHARILFSETFKVSKHNLNRLLYKLYYSTKHMLLDGVIDEKLEKVWDDCGKLTVYVFQLYEDCDCSAHESEAEHLGEKNESLKHMKRRMRSALGSMHSLHTSDDHEETQQFVKEIFG